MSVIPVTRLQFNDLLYKLYEKMGHNPKAISLMLQNTVPQMVAKYVALEAWLIDFRDDEGLIETLRYQLNYQYEHGKMDFVPVNGNGTPALDLVMQE
jgi:hypothetical protein